MSRPFRLLTFSLAAAALAVAGCTSTPYARMYSPRNSYYAAAPQKSEKSAEEILKATDGISPAVTPGALPPSDPAASPGLPPATAPAADPLATPPPAAPVTPP